MSKEKTTRCAVCYAEFTDEEIQGFTCCPNCGNKGVPCSIKEDVTIKINWHELRILSLWAERWAMHIEKEAPSAITTLDSIVQRLQKQCPDMTALTLRGEVANLKKQYPGMELRDGKGNVINTD